MTETPPHTLRAELDWVLPQSAPAGEQASACLMVHDRGRRYAVTMQALQHMSRLGGGMDFTVDCAWLWLAAYRVTAVDVRRWRRWVWAVRNRLKGGWEHQREAPGEPLFVLCLQRPTKRKGDADSGG